MTFPLHERFLSKVRATCLRSSIFKFKSLINYFWSFSKVFLWAFFWCHQRNFGVKSPFPNICFLESSNKIYAGSLHFIQGDQIVVHRMEKNVKDRWSSYHISHLLSNTVTWEIFSKVQATCLRSNRFKFKSSNYFWSFSKTSSYHVSQSLGAQLSDRVSKQPLPWYNWANIYALGKDINAAPKLFLIFTFIITIIRIIIIIVIRYMVWHIVCARVIGLHSKGGNHRGCRGEGGRGSQGSPPTENGKFFRPILPRLLILLGL